MKIHDLEILSIPRRLVIIRYGIIISFLEFYRQVFVLDFQGMLC